MDTTVPDANVIKIAVDLACRAPSLHNSQPWRWHYASGRLDLFGDRSRLLGEADPSGRQLAISCGAALHHLEIAMTSLRWRSEVTILPLREPPGPLASLLFHRDAHPHSHDFDLLTAIRRRRSDRRPFAPPPPAFLDQLDRGPRLLPFSGECRWAVLRRQALTDGMMDATFNIACEINRRPKNERSQDWIDRWLRAIRRSLEVLEGDIAGFGVAPTLAPPVGARPPWRLRGTVAATSGRARSASPRTRQRRPR